MTSDLWAEPVSVDDMYGDWDYEAAVATLARSLHPRASTSLHDVLEQLGVGPNDVVLDIGGRDARHSLAIAGRFGSRVVCVDPVAENIEDAMRAVEVHPHGELVQVIPGTIEQIPVDDGAVDVIFSRDMLAHISDLRLALGECARVLTAVGAMVVHGVFATALMEPMEAQRLYRDLAAVPERMSAKGFEETVVAAGFAIDMVEVIGSEWAEASQEAGTAPNYMLQVSRLRRGRERLVDELGEITYRVMYANALWSIYHMIGKLEARVYVLRRATS